VENKRGNVRMEIKKNFPRGTHLDVSNKGNQGSQLGQMGHQEVRRSGGNVSVMKPRGKPKTRPPQTIQRPENRLEKKDLSNTKKKKALKTPSYKHQVVGKHYTV